MSTTYSRKIKEKESLSNLKQKSLKPVVGRTLVTQRRPYPNLRQKNFIDMVKVMDANQ